jgi:HD-like signal output (HDOD) protein
MFSFFGKRTDPRARLQKVLRGYTLPSFPAAIMQTLQRIRDPKATSSSIAEALSFDPGLSVQVLRLANSVVFSSRKKIENLTQAIALVGLAQLETMVLSAGVGKATPARPSRGYDSARFWLASARRGALAHEFASTLCPTRKSECFTAGFLQEMAVPFLATRDPENYGRILEQWHDKGGSLCDLERGLFGWDHAEVATWMCDEWDFPENIAAAIGQHHGARYEGYEPLAPVSLVALLREREETLGVDALVEEAHTMYGIPADRVRRLLESSFEKADALAQLIP